MDGIYSAVMNKIKALGATGRYFIVSTDEFLEEFPEDAECDEAELKKALENLKANGYLDIRYSSGNMYCVAALKNYIPTEESRPAPSHTQESAKPLKTSHMFIFWAAFAGGAAGGIVTALISLLFILC